MKTLQAVLAGRKTYLIAAAIIAYQVIGHYVYATPHDVTVILDALGLGALRAGIAKR